MNQGLPAGTVEVKIITGRNQFGCMDVKSVKPESLFGAAQ
jgi:hypothetical protein